MRPLTIDVGTVLVLVAAAFIGWQIGRHEYHGDADTQRLRSQILWAVIAVVVAVVGLIGIDSAEAPDSVR